MGKASQRRKTRRMEYLQKMSFNDPARFEEVWDMRMESWLSDIRNITDDWKMGRMSGKRRVFEIVNEALHILSGCEASIYRKFAQTSKALLTHECCSSVARLVDPHLYRLSNTDHLPYFANSPQKRSAKNVIQD